MLNVLLDGRVNPSANAWLLPVALQKAMEITSTFVLLYIYPEFFCCLLLPNAPI